MTGLFGFLFFVGLITTPISGIVWIVKKLRHKATKAKIVCLAAALVTVVSFTGIGITYEPTEKVEEPPAAGSTEPAQSDAQTATEPPTETEPPVTTPAPEDTPQTTTEPPETPPPATSTPQEENTPATTPPEETEPAATPEPTAEPTQTVEPTTPQDNLPIVVSLDVSVEGDDGKPKFIISTNLPDETQLMLTLNGRNYTAQDKVTIKSGTATTAEFSYKGDPLSGKYTVDITMAIPRLQPDSVRAIIGEKGENITGPYVQESELFGENLVDAESLAEFVF